jgi:septal ring factor EnvC (AmiA/AmiB activator)
MAPRAPPNVTTQTRLPAHPPSASQTQAEAQMNPLPESDNGLEDDVAQLREQMRTITQDREDDQETLREVVEQLATIAAALVAQQNQNPVRSVERDDTPTLGPQERTKKYSKKLPDPERLSNGVDPTFESWRL